MVWGILQDKIMGALDLCSPRDLVDLFLVHIPRALFQWVASS